MSLSIRKVSVSLPHLTTLYLSHKYPGPRMDTKYFFQPENSPQRSLCNGDEVKNIFFGDSWVVNEKQSRAWCLSEVKNIFFGDSWVVNEKQSRAWCLSFFALSVSVQCKVVKARSNTTTLVCDFQGSRHFGWIY